ncbi:MAG: secondary thiamine-phosphate synthase enzyme YjbQ [Candidatus Bipolaricaulia bacterium]
MRTIEVTTRTQWELVDITRQVQTVVAEAEVRDGVCDLFMPHTTAGITINENADPNVAVDILNWLNELVPEDRAYAHREGNAPAHVKASLMGQSVRIFISNGALSLGTWQGVFFCEFDGPRRRNVWVSIREAT